MRDRLILASGSEIRRKLLAAAGILFDVDPADIDEDACLLPDPADRARALAVEKARAVSERHPGVLVLGSDQIFTLDGSFFSKPRNVADAAAVLRRMNGRAHRFDCGAALVRDGKVVEAFVERAIVRFYALTEKEIDDYAATGEGVGCAGAYRLEEGGVRLIESVEGSHFTVLGLPMLALIGVLRRLGWRF